MSRTYVERMKWEIEVKGKIYIFTKGVRREGNRIKTQKKTVLVDIIFPHCLIYYYKLIWSTGCEKQTSNIEFYRMSEL